MGQIAGKAVCFEYAQTAEFEGSGAPSWTTPRRWASASPPVIDSCRAGRITTWSCSIFAHRTSAATKRRMRSRTSGCRAAGTRSRSIGAHPGHERPSHRDTGSDVARHAGAGDAAAQRADRRDAVGRRRVRCRSRARRGQRAMRGLLAAALAPLTRAPRATPSGAPLVDRLEQVVRRELDLLVPPLGGTVVAGDDAAAMDATEVTEDEGVSTFVLSVAPTVSPRCHSA